jgi:predicted RNA-binding Zn-ribbon protein involved in translation (DUF1610 family)
MSKMICPTCGVEMNHHADKVDYSLDDQELIDPDFGGVLEEAFTCPLCGKTDVRRLKPAH